MDSKRHGENPFTAKEALAAQMAKWEQAGDPTSAACRIVGAKVAKRLQTTLMENNFSPRWLDPILRFIEDSVRELVATDQKSDGIVATLIAEVAALRFESLEFEQRLKEQKRRSR